MNQFRKVIRNWEDWEATAGEISAFSGVVEKIFHNEGLPAADIQSRIAGAGQAAIGFVDYPYTAIPLCIFVADSAAAVGAAVVHQNNFQIPQRLVQNGIHAPPQPIFPRNTPVQ